MVLTKLFARGTELITIKAKETQVASLLKNTLCVFEHL